MYEYAGKVERVIDGDTVEVILDLGFKVWLRQTVRLDGIDAPEMKTPEGKAAREFLAELVARNPVGFVTTRKDRQEKYGRYLADVRLQGQAAGLSRLMVEAGHAKPYSGGARAPEPTEG